MLNSTNGHSAAPAAGAISDEACRAVLERTCFGHLAFARNGHVDAVPIRFTFLEGWLYFRADAAMRTDIRHNRWAVMSVVDRLDATHFASVVARGACYATEDTGSPQGDAAALRGILRLRDRVPERNTGPRRDSRTSIVFRLHVDALCGSTTFVPCPAGGEELSGATHSHAASTAESSDEDARADDDGMREPPADRQPSGDVLMETA